MAASSYVVNDIFDLETDKTNAPDRVLPSNSININTAWKIYGSILFLGLVLSIYLAYYIDKLHFAFIYILIVVMIYVYSAYFKSTILLGNILVSALCALVIYIVYFAELSSLSLLYEQNPLIGSRLRNLIYSFVVFSFIISFYREIVKDVEDIEGDQKTNIKTMATVGGIANSKRVAMGIGSLLLACIFIFSWHNFEQHSFRQNAYLVLALFVPISYSLYLLGIAQIKTDFKLLSRLLKLIMALGLMFLLFGIN